MSPISGDYQTKDGRLSAVVIDSSLFLMIGTDSMVIYDLKIHFESKIDSNTYRLYKVLFNNSLTRRGYESINLPLKLEPNMELGGTLTAIFRNNDSFSFGGHYFTIQRNEKGKAIFENWGNLLIGNQETEMRLKYQKE